MQALVRKVSSLPALQLMGAWKSRTDGTIATSRAGGRTYATNFCAPKASISTTHGVDRYHIRTRLTSARGAGLCAVYVNDHIAWSSLLLRGNDRGAELATSKMYVNSLQRTDFLQVFAALPEPFAEVLSMSERPLMAFVPIPDEAVSDQDYDVVRELSLHLASAFLRADE